MIRRQTLKILLIFVLEWKRRRRLDFNQQRERESHETNEEEESCGRRLCAADFIYFFCFTRKNTTTLLVFNLTLRIFILNKFWTNKNNRLCLQRLGWMAGDNTIGSFEEHKLDIFVSKILCLHLLRKKCCKLDRKIWFFHAAVATRTYWKTAVRGSSDGRRPFPSATKDTSALRLP